jgi:tRNA A-37 threonylcarbamoyl transferase component Bud32
LSSKTDLKPDGFVTHPGMFRAKPEPNDKMQRPSELHFGVPEKGLFDCVILFECTLNIVLASFGQVVQYVQHFLPKGEARVILFDRYSFWLITCLKSSIERVEISKWTDNGSKRLFENFISMNVSPWVLHLTQACLHFNVEVVKGDSFLGQGAFGRVFKVRQQDDEVFALKIVEKRNVRRLHLEHGAMTFATETGVTASVVGDVMETTASAAFLVKPVGKPLPYPKTEKEVYALYDLLWQLHNKGIIHGDPRVPNVIVHEQTLLWIDLVDVFQPTTSILRQLDAETLTLSVLRVSQGFELDSAIVELIDNYGIMPTHENICCLAEVVYGKLQVTC